MYIYSLIIIEGVLRGYNIIFFKSVHVLDCYVKNSNKCTENIQFWNAWKLLLNNKTINKY